MKQRLPIAFLLLLCATPSVLGQSQKPSIAIGEVTVQIGESKQVVISRLRRYYNVMQAGSGSDYFVGEPNPDPDDPKLIGLVSFSGEVLTYASRYVYQQNVGYDAINSLYILLSKIEERGEVVISIKTSVQRFGKGFSVHNAEINTNKGRVVTMRAYDFGRDGQRVDIEEGIR
jgi:hypothetical protein